MDIQFKVGQMTKDPRTMQPAEREAWQLQCQIDARNYLFSIGQPLVYKKNGKYVAEYADGRIEVLR